MSFLHRAKDFNLLFTIENQNMLVYFFHDYYYCISADANFIKVLNSSVMALEGNTFVFFIKI